MARPQQFFLRFIHCMRWVTQTPQWWWRAEDNLQRSVLPSYHVAAKGLTQTYWQAPSPTEPYCQSNMAIFLRIQYKDCNNLCFKCIFFIIIVYQISTPKMNPLLGPFHTFHCSVAPAWQVMGGGELPSQFTQNHSLFSQCHTLAP